MSSKAEASVKDFTQDVAPETLTVEDIKRAWHQIYNEIRKNYIGRVGIFEMLWIAMLTSKHVYLEGVPGLGKTYMANTFAKTLGCKFSRIQFTPDMLPSDIVGTNIFNPKTGTFRLRKGPIFAHVVLADEINRAPPKTQSALLEAMAEGQVSIEGETQVLEKPFVVIATANPVEQEGTYPLPEAQLDRFLFKIFLNYNSADEELQMIKLKNNPIQAQLKQVVSPETIRSMMKVIKRVYVHPDILAYIRDIVIASRQDRRVLVGGSPRASESLLMASKARAAIHGREYVIPDDILALGVHILHHRLILKPEAELEGITAMRVAQDILNTVPPPVDDIEVFEEELEEEEEDEEEDEEEED